jgi:outer membrane protein TolC
MHVNRFSMMLICTGCWCAMLGCRQLVRATDREVAAAIAQRQRQTLDYSQPAPLGDENDALPEPASEAYSYAPSPSTNEVPADFAGSSQNERPATRPASQAAATQPVATSQPTRFRERVFTLTDALAYAQQHRREYQTAKEDLYLVALALTLERHLWTPIFAAELRGVYGNFGEITDFDQATRFVSDLSVSQRLPYGGDFTARAVSTLIRDVKRNITASEGGTIDLDLRIPFLRGAGHVAREDLIQLERDLSYAVRDFERFRRRQLVDVAQRYFDLLRSKQEVLDGSDSLNRSNDDYERAKALEEAEEGAPLDTRRAEQRMLSEENRLERLREAFRFGTDRFKLLIGMPVDEPIGLDDLEDIESIRRQIEEGKYPLLRRPGAADNETRALEIATRLRLDLLNRRDQIEDAKRGVAIARNSLLPDLNWNSTLTYDTDPTRFNVAAFESARATWRSELILSLPVERTRERARYRGSLIDVRRARRIHEDQMERIRVAVREAVNQIHLQERVLEIQRRNLGVASSRAEFARIQFREGEISNRDLVEAEIELVDALNELNLARTSRWSAILDFRLETETLRIDEQGVQHEDPSGP